MTTFDPSLAAFDRPDQLGGALQQGLPRPMNPKLTWSLLRTFFLGGITGGIVPILILCRRFGDFMTAEQLQFWHLAEWLRLQTGDKEAAAATDAARRVIAGLKLRWASIAFVIVAIGIAATALPHNGPMVPRWIALTLPQLQIPQKQALFDHRDWRWHGENRAENAEEDATAAQQFESGHFYRNPLHYLPTDQPTDQWLRIYHPDETGVNSVSAGQPVFAAHLPSIAPDLTNAFAMAMSGAALCWLIEINAHIGRVRRFVGAFNQLSSRYGVGPVRPPGLQLGLRPLWLLGAAALCTLGGFWGVPVMLAAAAQRRYIRNTSQRLRSDLARRQRDVLLAKRPTLRVPASTHLLGMCPREKCRAPFPPEAAYCRRCGTKLTG